MAEQRFDITPAVCHAQNAHVIVLNTVHYDIVANGKAPHPNAKVFVAGAS